MSASVELCLVVVRAAVEGEACVLLGEKRRGFGAGRVVVPGGKVDAGEEPAQAASRELREETALEVPPEAFTRAGLVTFRFPHGDTPELRAHVYVAGEAAGVAADSDEIAVEWVPEARIPYDRMWDDARVWLPRALAGPLPDLTFCYGPDNTTVEHVVGLGG